MLVMIVLGLKRRRMYEKATLADSYGVGCGASAYLGSMGKLLWLLLQQRFTPWRH
jgi:hypothetical protein